MSEIKFQIGKNGVNEGVIESLVLAFKNHKQIRIVTLKSSGRDKDSIKVMADELVAGLEKKLVGNKFAYKIIGFTVIMRKKKS
jgi:RNA-binding protein YhbY